MGAEVERALGRLPEQWDQLPLGRLAASTTCRSTPATVETVVLLRALASVLVVGEHTQSAALIAIPSSLWIAFRARTQTDVHFRDALLAGRLFHPLVQGHWFVAAVVQILLGLALLFAVPAVRGLERRCPFGLPAVLMGLALLAFPAVWRCRPLPSRRRPWVSTSHLALLPLLAHGVPSAVMVPVDLLVGIVT